VADFTRSARRSTKRSRNRHRVEEIIDFLEIQAIRKVPVARLPYGLQKRVELGRALAMEPDSAAARRTDGRHEPRRRKRTCRASSSM
jgi:ABC-type branched-subunit amino acid transport system ATPase component